MINIIHRIPNKKSALCNRILTIAVHGVLETMDVEPLRVASLAYIRKIFKQLEPPDEDLRHGFFRASFIGPWWLRHSAMPSIALSGLKGWQGKKFLSPFEATNIIEKHY